MTPEPVYIFVCGIDNFTPGSIRGWTKGGVIWANEHDLHADSFEYLTTPFTRFVRQSSRIRDLATLIGRYADRPIHLIAHSNGCEVVCHALQLMAIRGAVLHFFSPACPADFNENGLNDLLASGKVETVTVHYGGKDWAMWFAAASRTLVGWLGLGFGTLGGSGPKNVRTALQARVFSHCEPSFGHSTWFESEHFERTMELATSPISR